MKINLLHILIIAVIVSFLPIHAMKPKDQQLITHTQQPTYQSLPNPDETKKLVIAQALITTNNILPKNHTHDIMREELYTAVPLDDVRIDIDTNTNNQTKYNHQQSPLAEEIKRQNTPTPINNTPTTNLLTLDRGEIRGGGGGINLGKLIYAAGGCLGLILICILTPLMITRKI